MEGVSGEAFKLCQPDLGQPPEAFDAIDVDGSLGKLVLPMIDADVAIPEIDQAVVAAPAIAVRASTRPRIMPCSVGFEQSETISV